MVDGDDAQQVLQQAVLDSMPSQVALLDGDGTLVMVNAAWREFSKAGGCGRCGEGTNFFEVCRNARGAAGGDAERASDGVARVLAGEVDEFAMDVACSVPGGVRWFAELAVPLAGEQPGAVLSYTDITVRKQLETQSEFRATHDPLTGLPNRVLIDDRLTQALAGVRRSGGEVAVLFVDVDRFKEVNDRYGHAAGDAVLSGVARRLRRCVRPADTVGRLAGDEFVIVCSAAEAEPAAREVTHRVRQAMQTPLRIGGARIRVGVSIGVHVTGTGTAHEIIQLADKAMFHAKKQGGGRVSVTRAHGDDHREDHRGGDHGALGQLPAPRRATASTEPSREVRDREVTPGADDTYAVSVQRLLHLMRLHVGMEVAWTSEFVGDQQVFRFVDADPGIDAPEPGSATALSNAYCPSVLSGGMPALVPDARADPVGAMLPVTFEMHIGSYLGVPLHGPDGTPSGMLCAISRWTMPSLSERDLTSARLIADLIEDLHRRGLSDATAQQARARLYESVLQVCRGDGRHPVLQPIIDLRSGRATVVEALTRFDDHERDPAQWFATAARLGLGRQLELAAAEDALAECESRSEISAVAVNLSPEVVLDGALDDLLAVHDASRVIVEVTEHAPVESYENLQAVLDPHRENGLRLSVDDVGAGYASMTHVRRLRPDFIKVDMSLVRDIDTDPVRQALVAALQSFGGRTGATLIAEGVQTSGELDTVVALGIEHAQGFLFGMPSLAPVMSGHPARSAGVGGG